MSEHSTAHPTAPHSNDPLPNAVVNFGRMCGLVGVIGFVLLAIYMVFGATARAEAFRSLLFGFIFWLSISLGCLGFVMIGHLTGGGWGVVSRRFGEAAFLNLPYLFLVFLVLSLGFTYLFPWMHIKEYASVDVEAYKVLVHRQELNIYTPWMFWLRTVVYFAIWIAFAFAMRAGSLRLDRSLDLVLRRRLRKIAAGGMVLFFITTLFFTMDYFMSREVYWYSSIMGFITDVGMGAAGIAFMSLSVCYFSDRKPLKNVLTPQHLNDLGNIQLATVILWMYTNFAQYLIHWNGTEKEDVPYYTYRGLGAHIHGFQWVWCWIAVLLLFGHFFGPFFLLLMKGLKRNPKTFARIVLLILCMRIVQDLWVTAPMGAHRDWWDPTGAIYLSDLFAWLGVGGIWMFLYLRRLGTEVMLPSNAFHQPAVLTDSAHGTHAHAI
jgi:hypothetical protein